MLMNMTKLIKDIIVLEGLHTIALPFDKPIEIVIQEIMGTAIRTFSHFKPRQKECYEALKNLRSPDELSRKMGVYFIPSVLSTTYVHEAYAYLAGDLPHSGDLNISGFTVGSPFVGFGSYMPQDVLDATSTGAAINKYAGITSQPVTSEWLGDNKIRIYDVPQSAMLKFIADVDHDLNGETIEESCVESFKQLALLTVQSSLYKTLIQYQDVGSAYKAIQMKLEQWAGSSDKLESLINQWTETFHCDNIAEEVMFF